MKSVRTIARAIPLVLLAFTACTKLNDQPATPTIVQQTQFDTTTTTATLSGALDTTFGSNGHVITALGPQSKKDVPRGIAVTADGHILVGGQSQYSQTKAVYYGFALVRYDALGNLDRTFATTAGGPLSSGIQLTKWANGDAEVGGMVVDTTNSTYLVGGAGNASGNTDFAIAKYTPGGLLDTSYNYTGKRLTDFSGRNDFAKAAALDSSGRLVVVGTVRIPSSAADTMGEERFGMIRVNANGQSEDASFGTGINAQLQWASAGKVTTKFNLGRNQGANAVAIQTDGNIVVAGYVMATDQRTNDFAIARYLPSGALDPSFGTQGEIITDFGLSKDDVATSVVMQGTSVLVGGYSSNGKNTDFALARYTAAGRPDTTFGTNGRVTTDFGGDDYVTQLVIQPSGAIVAVGYALVGSFYQFAAARYTSGGTLDTGFGTNGKLTLSLGPNMNAYARAGFAASDGSVFFAGEVYPGPTQLDFAVAKIK